MKISIGKISDNPRIFNGFRLVKYVLFGKKGVRETRQSQPHGIDSSPIPKAQIVHVETMNKQESINIGNIDKTNKIATAGETRIYATDDEGILLFDIYLKTDGTCVFNSGTFSSTRFEELQTAFDELKADLNSFISTYNSHTHPYIDNIGNPPVPTPSVTQSTTSTGTSSAADISPSESPTIKIP